MLRVMLKTDYWQGEDAGLLRHTKFDPTHFTIKTMQDVVLLQMLHQIENRDILEVGGGHSRVLGFFCSKNRCTNVDPLEGEHGGPKGADKSLPYKQLFATVGESSGILADNSFDVVFSISVVEHVVAAKLEPFFAELARVLRRGGRMVHLIDTYLGVDDDVNAEPRDRLRHYRKVFETGQFRPTDPSQIINEQDLDFHPRYASNPDNIMNEWNHAAPSMKAIRARAQACSLILDAIRQ